MRDESRCRYNSGSPLYYKCDLTQGHKGHHITYVRPGMASKWLSNIIEEDPLDVYAEQIIAESMDADEFLAKLENREI